MTDKHDLKKFGITMAVAFLAIMLFILFRHKFINFYPLILSGLFLMAALFLPAVLKPVYIFWMKLAFVLAWINTRIILITLFYLIFTPIGLMMKVFNVDLLDRKLEKEKASYWHKKEINNFSLEDYKRQF